MSERDHVAETDRHIEGVKQRIARQKKIVSELERDGHDTDLGMELLAALEDALRVLEQHREVFLRTKRAEQS
jgi:predicted outer membrane protein